MFSTSTKKTIVFAVASIALLAADLQSTCAQQRQRTRRAPANRLAQVDYDAPPAPSRMAQVQNARRRAQNNVAQNNVARTNPRTANQRPVQRAQQGVRVAQNSNQNITAVQQQRTQGTRIVGGPRPNTGTYMPKHLRTAQLLGSPVVGGGAPIVGNSVLETQVQGNPVSYGRATATGAMNPLMAAPMGAGAPFGSPISSPIINPGMASPGIIGGNVVGGPIMGGEIIDDGGCCGGACGDGGCGVGESYFDTCDPCAYSNGGCPPESFDNCWLWGLGGILRRGEMFLGTTAFRSPGYNITDAAGGVTGINDCSFGFYGGANYGIPLCRLTCGFLSGQLGVRSVQSEFDENILTSDRRDQLFITAGLYRRVDYGLQAGIVADYLKEEWFGSASIAQIRGDISWVYGPSALGFRFTSGQDDDFTSGTINGNNFDNVLTQALDQYRFYYRSNIQSGGYCDLYAGWSDDDHTIFGVEADIPMSSIWALQTGFTYLHPGEDVAGQNDDAWNIYMGVAIRPRGRHFYGNYDRPLLPVADNGSMVVRRSSN